MVIEIEIRGPLNKEEFTKINNFFKQNAEFMLKKDRLSLLYFRNNIPKNVNEHKSEKVDLRLRITNKKPEIMLKYGNWSGSDMKKEISIPLELSKVENAIEFLKYLGWHICIAYATKTYVYKYKDIEFSLVDIRDFGYCYEAELVSDKADGQIQEGIRKVCQEIGLKEYKEGEFEKQCDEINNTKTLQYDFNKDNTKDLIKKFKEFF